MVDIVKAHAYGNDFLFVPARQVLGGDEARFARTLCDRHSGVGADGLVLYARTPRGAVMKLFNADGSRSEVSGNGVRCLAALTLRERFDPDSDANVPAAGTEGHAIVIETEAGEKVLTLVEAARNRYTFDAAMGQPEQIRSLDLEVAGGRVRAIALTVGNPQCVVLGPLPDDARFRQLGAALSCHSFFPAGTNVELAEVESPGRVRILIWERGVGPTLASGTGACAAAVAGAAYGGAGRAVEVLSPGGSQRVVWSDEGLRLTGWAEVIFSGRWLGGRLTKA